MLQKMKAEVLFLDPNDVDSGTAELIEHGFDVEILDWIDDDGPAVWVKAETITELDQDQFFSWVKTIVEPLQGDVVEAGLAAPSR